MTELKIALLELLSDTTVVERDAGLEVHSLPGTFDAFGELEDIMSQRSAGEKMIINDIEALHTRLKIQSRGSRGASLGKMGWSNEELVDVIMKNISNPSEPFIGLLPASELKRLVGTGDQFIEQLQFVLSGTKNQVIVLWDDKSVAPFTADRMEWLESAGIPSDIMDRVNFDWSGNRIRQTESAPLNQLVQEGMKQLSSDFDAGFVALLKPQSSEWRSPLLSLKTESDSALYLLHYLVQIQGNLAQDLLRVFSPDPKHRRLYYDGQRGY